MRNVRHVAVSMEERFLIDAYGEAHPSEDVGKTRSWPANEPGQIWSSA
jgi:hypothetical protein